MSAKRTLYFETSAQMLDSMHLRHCVPPAVCLELTHSPFTGGLADRGGWSINRSASHRQTTSASYQSSTHCLMCILECGALQISQAFSGACVLKKARHHICSAAAHHHCMPSCTIASICKFCTLGIHHGVRIWHSRMSARAFTARVTSAMEGPPAIASPFPPAIASLFPIPGPAADLDKVQVPHGAAKPFRQPHATIPIIVLDLQICEPAYAQHGTMRHVLSHTGQQHPLNTGSSVSNQVCLQRCWCCVIKQGEAGSHPLLLLQDTATPKHSHFTLSDW